MATNCGSSPRGADGPARSQHQRRTDRRIAATLLRPSFAGGARPRLPALVTRRSQPVQLSSSWIFFNRPAATAPLSMDRFAEQVATSEITFASAITEYSQIHWSPTRLVDQCAMLGESEMKRRRVDGESFFCPPSLTDRPLAGVDFFANRIEKRRCAEITRVAGRGRAAGARWLGRHRSVSVLPGPCIRREQRVAAERDHSVTVGRVGADEQRRLHVGLGQRRSRQNRQRRRRREQLVKLRRLDRPAGAADAGSAARIARDDAAAAGQGNARHQQQRQCARSARRHPTNVSQPAVVSTSSNLQTRRPRRAPVATR